MNDQKTVRGTITYQLSPDGQRAALLAGTSGARVQTVEVDIPEGLAQFFRVDADGALALNLSAYRPVGRADGKVRWDWVQYAVRYGEPLADPIAALSEAVAAAEAEAARLQTEESAREAERQRLLAEARLAADEWLSQDLEALQGAMANLEAPDPMPWEAGNPHAYPSQYYVGNDELVGQHNAARAAYLAARDQLKRDREESRARARVEFLAQWVTEYGSENQRARHAAGLLPEAEVIAAITDVAFFPVGIAQYDRITADEFEDDDTGEVRPDYCVGDANSASAAQWDAMEAVRAALPEGAEVKLRRHTGTWGEEEIVRFGTLAKVRVGPLTVVREFAAPDAD